MPIGELNEGPLHAALKAIYSANGGEQEVPVETFVADAVRGGVMYEIQTGSFSGLGRKMRSLADVGPVVLVHPIPASTVIVKEPAEMSSSKHATKKSRRRLESSWRASTTA